MVNNIRSYGDIENSFKDKVTLGGPGILVIDENEYRELLKDRNRLEFLALTKDKRYAMQIQAWILQLNIPNKVKKDFRDYLDYLIERYLASPFCN